VGLSQLIRSFTLQHPHLAWAFWHHRLLHSLRTITTHQLHHN